MHPRALLLTFTSLLTCVALVSTSHAAESQATPSAAARSATRPGLSSPTAGASSSATLDERIQEVKRDALQLNRDLLVLEEELLFPTTNQIAIFVSLDVGKQFSLNSVQIKLDDKAVANYLYTPYELSSLQRGGVQRIFLGNLRAGEHELTATFSGYGPNDRDYKRSATTKFEKGTDGKYIQLRIEDPSAKLQPELTIKVSP